MAAFYEAVMQAYIGLYHPSLRSASNHHVDHIFPLDSYTLVGETKELFEDWPPHLAHRLLRQKRCFKCWPTETEYLAMLDAVAPTQGALADETGWYLEATARSFAVA
jgi:hypothetical protein